MNNFINNNQQDVFNTVFEKLDLRVREESTGVLTLYDFNEGGYIFLCPHKWKLSIPDSDYTQLGFKVLDELPGKYQNKVTIYFPDNKSMTVRDFLRHYRKKCT